MGPRARLDASEKRKHLSLLAVIRTGLLVFPNCILNTKISTLYSGRNLRKMGQNVFLCFNVPTRHLCRETEREKETCGNKYRVFHDFRT